MNPFKNKYVMLGLAFAGGIILYNMFKKFTNKEDDETTGTTLQVPSNPPTTPVSGTSESILNDLDKQQAEDIKKELK